jgi:hypothetical protein
MAEDKLERKLGLFPATNIVVANMIGAGIFTTSGLLMAELHNPLLMVILWAVGGIIALCGALSYGELGAAMPGAGGEYLFFPGSTSNLWLPERWSHSLWAFRPNSSSRSIHEYFTRQYRPWDWLHQTIHETEITKKTCNSRDLIFTFIITGN